MSTPGLEEFNKKYKALRKLYSESSENSESRKKFLKTCDEIIKEHGMDYFNALATEPKSHVKIPEIADEPFKLVMSILQDAAIQGFEEIVLYIGQKAPAALMIRTLVTGHEYDEISQTQTHSALSLALIAQQYKTANLIIRLNPQCLGLRYFDGRNALHYAATQGTTPAQIDFITLATLKRPELIEQKTTTDGFAPIHLALTHANLGRLAERTVLVFINQKSKDATSKLGATPLHYAAQYGFAQVTRSLLEANANQFIKVSGVTPLEYALKYVDKKPALSGVLELFDIKSLCINNPKDLLSKLRDIIEPKYKVAFEFLFSKFKEWHKDVANMLCKDGLTLLQAAAGFDNVDAMSLLLQIGADPLVKSENRNQGTALHVAAENDAVNAIKVLAAHTNAIELAGTKSGVQGVTAAHAAAFFGKAKALRALIDAFPFLKNNQENPKGYSPLHVAAQEGHAACCAMLGENIELNLVAQGGFTPFMIAMINAHDTMSDPSKTPEQRILEVAKYHETMIQLINGGADTTIKLGEQSVWVFFKSAVPVELFPAEHRQIHDHLESKGLEGAFDLSIAKYPIFQMLLNFPMPQHFDMEDEGVDLSGED